MKTKTRDFDLLTFEKGDMLSEISNCQVVKDKKIGHLILL